MTWMSGLLVLVAIVSMYLLYTNGYMWIQSKTALTFFGSGLGGRKSLSFQFTGCDGFVRRVMKVNESGTYTVTLDASLSKGKVRFQVLDAAKLPVLILDPEHSQGRVVLEAKKRYFVQMDFLHTSGDCRAYWEKE